LGDGDVDKPSFLLVNSYVRTINFANNRIYRAIKKNWNGHVDRISPNRIKKDLKI
jgi:hypothetical protein